MYIRAWLIQMIINIKEKSYFMSYIGDSYSHSMSNDSDSKFLIQIGDQ